MRKIVHIDADAFFASVEQIGGRSIKRQTDGRWWRKAGASLRPPPMKPENLEFIRRCLRRGHENFVQN